MKTKRQVKGYSIGLGLSIGITIGTAIGLELGNIALGTAFGVSFGLALGFGLANKNDEDQIKLSPELQRRTRKYSLIALGIVLFLSISLVLGYFMSR